MKSGIMGKFSKPCHVLEQYLKELTQILKRQKENSKHF
tara:strand:+ start:4495 stop:4608 length:114 start_codon:yes stop_codon:yes gene_type:complete